MKGFVFFDEYILTSRALKDALITLGAWDKEYVEWLERNKKIEYVEVEK